MSKFQCIACHRVCEKPIQLEECKPITAPGKEGLAKKDPYKKYFQPYCPFCLAEFYYRNIAPMRKIED